jgi:hypothetical protein
MDFLVGSLHLFNFTFQALMRNLFSKFVLHTSHDTESFAAVKTHYYYCLVHYFDEDKIYDVYKTLTSAVSCNMYVLGLLIQKDADVDVVLFHQKFKFYAWQRNTVCSVVAVKLASVWGVREATLYNVQETVTKKIHVILIKSVCSYYIIIYYSQNVLQIITVCCTTLKLN